MKKVFLSVPMKGRTKEDIDKSVEAMKAVTKAYLPNEELEFINTIVEEKPPYNTAKEAVWYLGKSVQLLSQADYFVFVDDCYDHPGCYIEKEIAYRYGILPIDVSCEYVCPDIIKKRREEWEKPQCCGPVNDAK